MSAYALFNGLRASETSTSSANNYSIRSSVHSASSSMTTSSSGDEQVLAFLGRFLGDEKFAVLPIYRNRSGIAEANEWRNVKMLIGL